MFTPIYTIVYHILFHMQVYIILIVTDYCILNVAVIEY